MYMANSRVLLIGQTGMKNFSEVNFVFMDLHGLDKGDCYRCIGVKDWDKYVQVM